MRYNVARNVLFAHVSNCVFQFPSDCEPLVRAATGGSSDASHLVSEIISLLFNGPSGDKEGPLGLTEIITRLIPLTHYHLFWPVTVVQMHRTAAPELMLVSTLERFNELELRDWMMSGLE